MAGVFFPVRAREALRKATAQLLEQLGDFAFYTLGEFCQARFCWERLHSSVWFQEAAGRLCLLHAGRVLPGAVLLGALAQQCLL